MILSAATFLVAGLLSVSTLPFDGSRERIFVPVDLPNAGRQLMLLDTGAEVNVLETLTAREMGVRFLGPRRVAGVGEGQVEGFVLADAKGDLAGRPVAFELALDLQSIGLVDGQPLMGILGISAIGSGTVTVDPDRNIVTLGAPPPQGAPSTGLTPGERLPIVPISLVVRGITIPARAMIDSGAVGTTILPHFVARNPLLQTMPGAGPTVVAEGIGGQLTGRYGRLSSLSVGPVTFQDPIVGLAERGGRLSRPPYDLVLGMDLLRRLQWTLDLSLGRLWVREASSFSLEFAFDQSGLQLGTRTEPSPAVTVRSVLPNSPARDLGIRAGDVLLTLEGVPVRPENLSAIRAELRRPNRSWKIVWARGASFFEGTLQGRDLL